MYTVRITHHPAPGKAAELRKVLEEHSKASNAEGSPHNVSQPLYASDLTYVNGIRHESLAALEAYGTRSASDPASTARRAKIAPCLDRPQTSVLYENLVNTPRTGDINYALRRTFYPTPGKAGELRKVLEQRANTPSTGSVGKGLSTQVLGPDRAHFVLTTLFSSLEGFEQYLKAQPADAAVQSFVAQLGKLSADNRTELDRILVRFAAQ